MKNSIKEKHKLWIFSIITIIAIITISISVGQFSLTSFPFGSALDKPISYTQNDGSYKTVIDSSGKRISIINEKNEVCNQISLDQSEIASNISVAQYAFIYNNQLYVYGYLADEKYTSINSVVGVKISLQGNFIDKIMEINQTDDEFYTINNIWFNNDKASIVLSSFYDIFFVELNPDSQFISNKNISSFEKCSIITSVYDIIYLDNIDSYIIFDALGNQYIKNQNGLNKENNINKYFNNEESQTEINFSGDIINDKSFTLIDKNTKETYKYAHFPLSLNIKNNNLYYANSENDTTLEINLSDNTKEENSLYLFIPLLLLWVSIYILSLLYVIIFIVFVIVKGLLHIKRQESKRYYQILIGLAILLGIFVTTQFLLLQTYNATNSTTQTHNQTLSEIISDTVLLDTQDFKLENLNQAESNPAVYENTRENLLVLYDTLMKYHTKHRTNDDQQTSFNIYLYNKEKDMFEEYLFDFSIMSLPVKLDEQNDINSKSNKDKLKNGDSITGEITNRYVNQYYSYSPIYNKDNNIVAAIQICSSYDSWMITITQWQNEVILFMIIALIIIFLIMQAWNNIRVSIKNYINRKKKKLDNPEIFLAGPFEFFANFVSTIDSVLCVLLTKDILQNYGLADNGVLIGLPLTFFGIGALIGGFTLQQLTTRLSIKRIYLISSGLTAIFLCANAASIYLGNYWMLLISKFLFGISYGTINSANYNIPMCSNDEKLIYKTMRSLTLTDISGPILSVMAASIAASVFGAFSIYLVATLAAISIFVMVIFFIPKNKKFENASFNKPKKINFGLYKKFLTSPTLILCAVALILSLCVGAYKSYLFPLYTNSLNISNDMISNYFVIASTLVLIFSPSLDAYLKKFDHWNNIILCFLAMGIIFCLFVFNQTFLWAILAFFLSCIIQKSSLAEIKVIIPRKCKHDNIDPTVVQPLMSITGAFGLCVRPIILGFFIGLGTSWACVALGLTCLIFITVFTIFTRNTSIRNIK